MPETSTPPASRRFQVVPIEETTKKVRRFAPEPVETTTRSNKKDTNVDENNVAGKKHLLPVPVETSSRSSRSSRLSKGTSSAASDPPASSIPKNPPPTDAPKPRRRFVPDLIETSKRSKRAGDSRPATLPTDKVKALPFVPSTCADRCGKFRRTSRPVFQIYTRHGQSQIRLKPHISVSRSSRRHLADSRLCIHTLIRGEAPDRTLSTRN